MDVPNDQERLVQGILTSLTSALGLITDAREHHALCTRSISMMATYESEWVIFHAEKWSAYSDEEKELRSRWYAWIKLTADSAEIQKMQTYKNVIERSVIYLADVLENLTESLLQVCLQYIDRRISVNGKIIDIEKITSRRSRDDMSYKDVRRSVRAWERKIPHSSRTERFSRMICTFLPDFTVSDQQKKNLDQLMRQRNSLTHELIVVPLASERLKMEEAISEEQVQSYYDDLAAYVMALLDAFRGSVRAGAGQP